MILWLIRYMKGYKQLTIYTLGGIQTIKTNEFVLYFLRFALTLQRIWLHASKVEEKL